MMNFFVDRITILAIAIPIVALLFVGYISYDYTIQFIKIGALVDKINLIIQRLDQLSSKITDAETGQRGFIITDRPDYLEPYDLAIKDIRNQRLTLIKLVDDEPAGQQQLSSLNELTTLKNLINEKLAELNQTISLRQSHGLNAALSIIQSNKGKIIMDKIRATTLDIQNQQNNILSNATRQSQSYEQIILFTIIITTLVAAGVASMMLFVISRSIQKRHVKTERLLQTEVKKRTEELQSANNQLLIANEQLKINDRIQKEFINVAAHELRTPLQPIIGLTQTLHHVIKDTHQLELLNIIIRNTKRLSKLTENILDLTKIESNTLHLRKEQVNLHKLISNLITDYNTNLKEDNNYTKSLLLISDQFTEDHIFVQADKSRISQVIINLLDNAIKFAKENSIITISIKKIKDNNQILVTVKDNGIGIDPEILPKLFSKFTTNSFQGIGLGLFLSKRIVEAHGGRIWAENNNPNTQDEGAMFAFILPINDQL